MNKLPPGWVHAPIGDLVEFNPKNQCKDEMNVGFVPLNRMGTRYREQHSFEPRRWLEVKKGYTHFRDGDVLLARITPCFENGKAGIAKDLPSGVGAGSTEYFVLRPKSGVLDARYLLAFLKTSQFMHEGERRMAGAVGQQRVPKQYVLDAAIPLAPLAEQTLIANKLDDLFARADRYRERMEQIPPLLKRFREAVLESAMSGRLTAEWRPEDLSQKRKWHKIRLGHVLDDVRYGTAVKCSYEAKSATPVLRIPNVAHGRIDLSDVKYGRLSKHDRMRLSLKKGDLLMVRSNGSVDLVGRVAVVPDGLQNYSYAGYLIRLRPDCRRVLPEFLAAALASPAIRRHIELTARSTSGVNNINSEEIRQIELDIPSLREQAEITRRVDRLLATTDSIQLQVNAARSGEKKIASAVLARAFRGELVSKDPPDEPASLMLVQGKVRQVTESCELWRSMDAMRGRTREKKAAVAGKGRKAAGRERN